MTTPDIGIWKEEKMIFFNKKIIPVTFPGYEGFFYKTLHQIVDNYFSASIQKTVIPNYSWNFDSIVIKIIDNKYQFAFKVILSEDELNLLKSLDKLYYGTTKIGPEMDRVWHNIYLHRIKDDLLRS